MKTMKELFETARKSMEKKQDLVFVTTISSSGSSPRGAGSKMLVLENGTSYGTIGGGNVEYVSIQHAREVLKQKQSCTRGFALHPDQVADLGMICGGDVVIFFQYISWENQDFYDLCTRILKSWDKNENTWLIFDITEETVWKAGLYEEQEGLTGLGISDPSPLCRPRPCRRFWMVGNTIVNHWYKKAEFIFSVVDMWRRHWFLCWPVWNFAVWYLMIERLLAIHRYFQRQNNAFWGILTGFQTTFPFSLRTMYVL